MPRAARRGSSECEMKSRTTSVSLNPPSIGASIDAMPRSAGARSAAFALRACGESGAHSLTSVPNGSFLPFVAKNFSAFSIASMERFSHSAEVCAHVVNPCPPRITPFAAGFSLAIFAISRPSWKPGRRQSTQRISSPKHSLVSAGPSAAVARAIMESGCK